MVTIELDQQEWVDLYARKMMENLHTWQGPLGVDDQYKQLIKKELACFFDDPLKRSLVETTY
jgi:hypothetical protein